MLQGIERGRAEPDWWLNAPDLSGEDQVYLKAFWELSSTRSYAMGFGPIPQQYIWQYADRLELDHEMTELFSYVIREMDSAYLTWQTENKPK